MSISTAKRRRRQAKNGYSHLAKLGRPIYAKKSKEKADAQRIALIKRQNERRQRGAKF
ncbi:MAG: hypothetical protein KDA57_13955 [Planctomycetales bacterium]|nr:hypothetical protein [Planctomycetales bacterium]